MEFYLLLQQSICLGQQSRCFGDSLIKLRDLNKTTNYNFASASLIKSWNLNQSNQWNLNQLLHYFICVKL